MNRTEKEQLVSELSPMLDLPFAFYGHCLGGLTLYETARRLIHTSTLRPQHLFVSGARPPDRHALLGVQRGGARALVACR